MHVPATFALFDQTKKWGNLVIFHDPCCANRALTIGGFLACNNWPSDLRSLRCTGHSGRSGFGRLGCFSHLAIRGRGRGATVVPWRMCQWMFPNHGPTIRQQEQQKQRRPSDQTSERSNKVKVKYLEIKNISCNQVIWLEKRCLFWWETMIFGDVPNSSTWPAWLVNHREPSRSRSAIKKSIRNQRSNDRCAPRIVIKYINYKWSKEWGT